MLASRGGKTVAGAARRYDLDRGRLRSLLLYANPEWSYLEVILVCPCRARKGVGGAVGKYLQTA